MWQSPNGGKPLDLGHPQEPTYLHGRSHQTHLLFQNQNYIIITKSILKLDTMLVSIQVHNWRLIPSLHTRLKVHLQPLFKNKVSRMPAPTGIHQNLILVVLVNEEITHRWLDMIGNWKIRPGETAQSRCQLNRCTISWWSRVTMASRSLSGFHVAISTFKPNNTSMFKLLIFI